MSVTKICSPLRYPGGKAKAVNLILPYIPEHAEYREPFFGGGSVMFGIKQTRPTRPIKYVAGDLNYDLCCFWVHARDDADYLVDTVTSIKRSATDGRELHRQLVNENPAGRETFRRAVRFFVLNRITFSGTVESGGYSEHAFNDRFTESSIQRLQDISQHLQDVEFRYGSYEELLSRPGKDVFIYLDPPYLTATKSKLYGKKGDLHTQFDHIAFARACKECEHKWLISYDDSEEIRKLFSWADIVELSLQYGMNNYKQSSARRGQELLIKNY